MVKSDLSQGIKSELWTLSFCQFVKLLKSCKYPILSRNQVKYTLKQES